MALTTYTSQNLGARAYDRAKKGARFGVLSAVILAELIGLALYLLIPQLAALFSDTPEVIRRCVGLPRRRESLCADACDAGHLVRAAHRLYHPGDENYP